MRPVALAVVGCLLLVAAATTAASVLENEPDLKFEFLEENLTRGIDHVGDKFFAVLETFVSDGREARSASTPSVEGRKKKHKKKLNKYVMPLLVGFLLIKSVLLPLTLKALAILSGKAVVLSLMSLILAAIVGLRSVANGFAAKIDHHAPTKYRRKDWPEPNTEPAEDDRYDPYQRYPYAEKRRRRRK